MLDGQGPIPLRASDFITDPGSFQLCRSAARYRKIDKHQKKQKLVEFVNFHFHVPLCAGG
jgi:hypothetical protein